MNKKKNKERIPYIIVLILLLVALCMPKTGRFVLLDELADVLVIWGAFVAIVVWIRRMGKSLRFTQTAWRIGVIIVGMCIGIWFSGRLVMDMVSGPQKVTLYNIEVSQYRGKSGFISLHYYIQGYEKNGNRMRFEISYNDYSTFQHEDEATIEYYKYSDRVKKVY